VDYLLEECEMATFISLINFTDQGIRDIKKSPGRAEHFKEVAGNLGVKLKETYWTVGNYDVVAVLEGSEEAVTAALLTLGALGNVRTQTLRAFSAYEIGQVMDKMP
jgi:uncharacterized protein with GYD domain